MNKLETQIRDLINGDYLIGRYTSSPEPHFKDIRGSEGEQLDLEEIISGKVTAPYSGAVLEENEFYQFEWTVNEDSHIVINGAVSPVDKEALVRRLLDIFKNKKGLDHTDAIKNQELVLQEVTGSVKTYLYELLQNANDYPYNKEDVHVKFILTDNYLFFVHTGAEFDLLNIVGICSIHQGDKRNKKNTIGYKGIGFKTVFVKNNYVYLKSGNWSIRFDEEQSREAKGGNKAPWIRMPWQTDYSSLDPEIRNVLDALPQEYRVQFALRHMEDAAQNNEHLDRVFGDDEILLFIPNVTDVEVSVKGKTTHHVTKNRDNWEIRSYLYPVPDKLREWVKEDIKRKGKTPPKFEDIEEVNISFAVQKDGNQILPLTDTRVYNYLPTELRMGLPFIINADFIPDASRSGLHDIEWNYTILYEAGKMFANVIAELIESGNYDLKSIFDILPTQKYEDKFSVAFRKGFNDGIKDCRFIPVEDEKQLYSFQDIIFDQAGLTTSETILTDDEFYEINGREKKLPHKRIRNNSRFISLLEDYCPKENRLTAEWLFQKAYCKELNTWLLDLTHNCKFHTYIFENFEANRIKALHSFLNSDGVLQNSKCLFYDLDRWYDDLSFIGSSMARVSPSLRKHLEETVPSQLRNYYVANEGFKTFDPIEWIKQHSSTLSSSISKENSIRLFHFISQATKAETSLDYVRKSIALYREDDKCTRSLSNLYIRDEFGTEVSNFRWVEEGTIRFISPEYWERDKEDALSCLKKIGISAFNSSRIVRHVLHEHKGHILSTIGEDTEADIHFYRFLHSVESSFHEEDKETLQAFNISVHKKDTCIRQRLSLNNIFFSDKDTEDLIRRKWMGSDYFYILSDVYFQGLTEKQAEGFKLCLGKWFGIKTYKPNDFYLQYVFEHISPICSRIKDAETSVDFLNYLFENRKTLFGDDMPPKVLLESVPVMAGALMRKYFTKAFYVKNAELEELQREPWYQASSSLILSDEYSPLIDGKERREFFAHFHIKPFSKNSYIRDFILSSVGFNTINSAISKDPATNAAFHKFCSKMDLNEADTEILRKYIKMVVADNESGYKIRTLGADCYYGADNIHEIAKSSPIPTEYFTLLHNAYEEAGVPRTYFEKLGCTELNKSSIVQIVINRKQNVLSYQANIELWNWIYDNLALEVNYELGLQYRLISSVSEEGSCTLLHASKLFASEEYFESTGLNEEILRTAPDTKFVSPCYLQHGSPSEWKKIFKRLGVAMDIKAIAFRIFNNDLANQKNTGILKLLAHISDELVNDLKLDNTDTRAKLENLWLKCNDGRFLRPVGLRIATPYYDYQTCNLLENITIGNAISGEYMEGLSSDVQQKISNLLRTIGDKFGIGIPTETRLYEDKIIEFCSRQQTYVDNELHYQIISDIAVLYDRFPTMVEKYLPQIRIVSETGVLLKPSSLYLGHEYDPVCDYDGHGVGSLDFVSKSYSEKGDITLLKQLFKQLGVKETFAKENLEQLGEESFARYFWNIYAIKNKSQLTQILTEDNLKNLPCIPTKRGIKKPSEVYDIRNSIISHIANEISCYDKIPDIGFPEWIDKIGLKSRIDILDCLEYLSIGKVPHRDKVVYDISQCTDIDTYSHEIHDFVDKALWKNGKGGLSPMKDLVALDYDNSTLQAEFGNSEYVFNRLSLSAGIKSTSIYEKICSIFNLTVLTDDSFHRRADQKDFSASAVAVSEIKKRALYLAFRSGEKDWEDKYQDYCKIIDDTEIIQCAEISLHYNENIRTDLIYYAPEKENKLWFAGAWDHYCAEIAEWMVRVLGLNEGKELVSKWLHKPFSSLIEGGSYPKEFYAYLDDAEKSKVSIAADDEDDAAPEINEKAIIRENSPEREDTTLGTSIEHKNVRSTDNVTSPKSAGHPVDSSNQSPSSVQESETNAEEVRTTSSPIVSHVSSEMAKNEAPAITEIKFESAQDMLDSLHEKWKREACRNVHCPVAKSTVSIEDIQEEKPEASQIDTRAFSGANALRKNSSSDTAPKTIDRSKHTGTPTTFMGSGNDISKVREQANDINREQNIRWHLDNTPRYSFLWFSLLLELEEKYKANASGIEYSIKFEDWSYIPVRGILKLSMPVGDIPSWLESAASASVQIRTADKLFDIPARGLCIEQESVSIKLSGEALPTGLIAAAKYFNLSVSTSGGIFNSLRTRFLSLGFEDNYNMADNLPSNIEFIYGPPGTGKTTELARRIAECVDTGMNILVLTPTNKAADVITCRLMEQHPETKEYLSRYGTTQSLEILEDGTILQTPESLDIGDRDANIIITTTTRFSYGVVQPNNLSLCDIEWDILIIDEASMVRIEEITYILHGAKADAIIIAGDPRQIQPVYQKELNIGTENIYKMIGLDSLGEAINTFKRFKVTPLMTQHRSVPSIGGLVSRYSYDGLVQADVNREPQKPLSLPGLQIKDINFITFETKEIDMMYSALPVNNSPVQVYSIIFTYNFVQKLSEELSKSYPGKAYSIGVISPYRAEADALKSMFNNMDNVNKSCTISCGTVHGFQGDQCDIMVVVMNPALYNGGNANTNDPNLINVAISRAKDYLFMICPNASSHPTEEQNNLGLVLINGEYLEIGSHEVEAILFGDSHFVENNTNVTSHQPVNIYKKSERMFDVKINETAIDIQIDESLRIGENEHNVMKLEVQKLTIV